MSEFGESLYKSHGVLWRTVIKHDREFISDNPLCPNETCHMVLERSQKGYLCRKCKKEYEISLPYPQVLNEVRNSWEGFQTLHQKVYSLDLPPTKVVSEGEDENYWVQARISEKEGKRMAVVYFGQRLNGKQNKSDYSQVFLDFEDEQLRFDKNNKNPMKLLAKLSAEFPESDVVLKSKINQ